jgi:hypothetical protein
VSILRDPSPPESRAPARKKRDENLRNVARNVADLDASQFTSMHAHAPNEHHGDDERSVEKPEKTRISW